MAPGAPERKLNMYTSTPRYVIEWLWLNELFLIYQMDFEEWILILDARIFSNEDSLCISNLFNSFLLTTFMHLNLNDKVHCISGRSEKKRHLKQRPPKRNRRFTGSINRVL